MVERTRYEAYATVATRRVLPKVVYATTVATDYFDLQIPIVIVVEHPMPAIVATGFML
jgi:hypothetical protein